MNLEDAPTLKNLEIVSITEASLSENAFRFGIESGECIKIINKFPGGPIVIQRNQQQIAIGRELAKSIEVRLVENKSA